MRKEGGLLRLEEASAMPGSEDGLFEFYQPDEVVRLEDLVPASELPTPDQMVERQELQRTVNRMLVHLPTQWRLALVLHEAGGCSLAETAHVLGITESEVKHALDNARAFLKQKLAELHPSGAMAHGDHGQRMNEPRRMVMGALVEQVCGEGAAKLKEAGGLGGWLASQIIT